MGWRRFQPAAVEIQRMKPASRDQIPRKLGMTVVGGMAPQPFIGPDRYGASHIPAHVAQSNTSRFAVASRSGYNRVAPARIQGRGPTAHATMLRFSEGTQGHDTNRPLGFTCRAPRHGRP